MGDIVVLGHTGLLCLKQMPDGLQRVHVEGSSLMPLLESVMESYKITKHWVMAIGW